MIIQPTSQEATAILNPSLLDKSKDYNKLHETYRIAEDIISQLTPEATLELWNSAGSENDIDQMFNLIADETYKVLYGETVDRKAIQSSQLGYLDMLSESIDETLRCENLNYFITSVLPDFEINWHHVQWGEIAMKHPKFCILASRDGGKSYFFSMAYPAWQLYRFKPKNNTSSEQMNKRGFLFSFSALQAIDLLAILKENIEDIDVLKDRLYNKDSWSKTDITCKNRARLTTKGFGSAARGAHPGWIIVDDGLKDNVLYSSVQRQKNIDYFHAVIMNMITPNGQVGVVGTPFHGGDLYGDLKIKPNWFVYEYPGIFPNGDILWAKKWNYEALMEKRKSQGNLIFSREILCRPITSDSTIFPIEILNNAFYRMEDMILVENRESYKIKFDKVVVGSDFAISSSVGADYSVFGVWGIDEKERMWLMHFWRKKGASYDEQLAKLKSINANFRPDLMMLEKNQMQQIFVEGAVKENLPVKGHTTGTQKNDLRKGLPGLAIMFERGMFKIPQGNQYSKDVGDLFVTEFSSVAFTDKGLMATDGHDDIAMMSWISVECARNITINEFKFDFV